MSSPPIGSPPHSPPSRSEKGESSRDKRKTHKKQRSKGKLGKVEFTKEDEVLRNKLIMEMLESERAHVQALNIVVDNYLSPLIQGGILTPSTTQEIFSNLELIRNWNQTFLQSLEAHLECGDTFGDLFLEMIPVMRQLYMQYNENYAHAMETYENAKRLKIFSTFLERKQKEIGDNKDLLTYLYLPVQRMIAYDSLLKDILSLTPKDHADYSHLNDCLQSLRDIQYNAEQRAKQRKNIDKVIEISSKFEDQDTQLALPHRRYIYEGEAIRIYAGRNFKERYCYLFNDLFLCCKTKKKGKLEIDFKEPLKTLKVEDMQNFDDFRYVFRLTSSANEYILSSPDKDHWIYFIQQCAKDLNTEKEEPLHAPHNAVEESSRESLINRILSWSKMNDADFVLQEVKELAAVLEKYRTVNVIQPVYNHGVL